MNERKTKQTDGQIDLKISGQVEHDGGKVSEKKRKMKEK